MTRAKTLGVLLVLAVLGAACGGFDPLALRRGHSGRRGETETTTDARARAKSDGDERSAELAQLGGLGEWLFGHRRRANDDYPLDVHARRVPEEGRLACPDVELVRYRIL